MTLPPTTDVLVVGAGPTGLMLANQLRRHDVDVVVIDQNDGPSVATKALGVHARTLEIYARLGIVDHAIKLGRRATGANMWANGSRAARIPLKDIGRYLSAYPFVLILGQDDNEKLLGDALRARGTDIHWGTALSRLEQFDQNVGATLEQSGSRLNIKASWVAGCDGARSAVRHLNGIEFPGAPYEHVFFVADTRATGAMVKNELNIFLWPGGFHLFFPMRGADHWRVVGILPMGLRARDDLSFDELEPSIRTHTGADILFDACDWFSTYRIHHRRAARFRNHRCFLLGDAAHIHSPAGAQGMNTGLQDAYNLGWKLGWVCSGRANEELLNSYEIERIPVADRLLRTTDQVFSVAVSDGWLARLVRTRLAPRLLGFATRFETFRRLAFRTVSQIGIRYRKSPLSKSLANWNEGKPRPGDRFPWMQLKISPDGEPEDIFAKFDDTKMNLVLIGEHPADDRFRAYEDLLTTLRIRSAPFNQKDLSRCGIPSKAFYLLRPDGHIGLAGRELDDVTLRDYLMNSLCLQIDDQSRLTKSE